MRHAGAPSLQRRLLVSLLGGLAITVVVLGLISAAHLWEELDEQLDDQLIQTAELLLQVAPVAAGGPVQPLHTGPFRDPDHAPQFQVARGSTVLIRSADAPATLLWPDAVPGFHGREWRGERWRVYSAQQGPLRVWVGDAQGQRLHWLAEAFESWPVIWPAAFALLGSLLVLGLRHLLRPLRHLEAEVEQRQPGSLRPLAPGPLPRELQPLVEALNALLGRMGEALERERQFTADAAHELRTPIAALRVQAQVALGADGARERQEALHAVLASCDRAAHLIDQLLALARLDQPPAADTTPGLALDLSALTREVLAELLSVHPQRVDDLQLEAPPACHWRVHDVLWSRLVLRNLLDNALRYSPAGTPVRVVITPQQLRIEDGGPGLAPAQRAALGRQRFWRGDASSGGGTGLGWAIVRRCAQHLGWTVAVEASALGGLAVQVTPQRPD